VKTGQFGLVYFRRLVAKAGNRSKAFLMLELELWSHRFLTVPPEAVDPTLAYVDFLIGVGIGILISVSFIFWSAWRR
jgi:hypothetical protein